jgi:integrase
LAAAHGARSLFGNPEDANRLQGLRAELAQLETKSTDAVSYTSILERWNLERGTDGSLQKYTGFMKQLFEFAAAGDANRITTEHILDFETSLRQEGRLQANTISNMLAGYKALFRFAKRRRMITVDPAEDIEVPAKQETGKKNFPPAMAKRIVTEAQQLRPELYLAVLIQSVTGCRVSEILNRLTTDIHEEEGAIVFEVPKTGAGKGKTKSSARKIPVHPAIAEMLLAHRKAVIERHGEGLLFPELPRGKDGKAKPSVYGTRVIDEWFRDKLEIKDKIYSPNHSWRHTVKTALLKAKVDPTIRNMITGHGKNVAQEYEHGDIAMMVEAITSTLPNPIA